MSLAQQVADWVDRARGRIGREGITMADLDELVKYASSAGGRPRQRLLYISAESTSIHSPVISMAVHEPVPGALTEIDPTGVDWPYGSVHDALIDGWRVVHFPDQRAPFAESSIDILGYQFILEKMERFHD